MFKTIEEMIAAAAAGVKAATRMRVSEYAEKSRKLNTAGAYVGPWDNKMAPYLVEVMDVLTSREFTGMAFAGPARCGKSDIFFNWLGYTAEHDPADMMIIHMTKDVARDWSKADLTRFLRHTKTAGKTVVPGRNNQNVHDVGFLSGMRLLIKWPTVSEVSGKTLPRLWVNDHDRIEDDIDKEGPIFDLAKARATTFKRYGMTAAESSPGRDNLDPKWLPPTPHSHMAPPTTGILAVYNRGDRRRWYWRCPSCNHAFEPDFKNLTWPDSKDIMEAAEQAVMKCPHCSSWMPHDNDTEKGLPGKYEMNLNRGKWIKEGQFWLPDGSVEGTPIRSDIASFWLKGPAAAFVDWKTTVADYLTAVKNYEETGDEGPLRVNVNTKQGLPYTPKSLTTGRLPEEVKALSRDMGKRVVPAGVRFLLMLVDVQRNRFEVQTVGFGVGGTMFVIDRFAIYKAARLDDDGERERVRPGAYLEDWDLLTQQCLLKTYPLSDDSGRHMGIKGVACDSGGEEGVTEKAYNFWRRLRDSDGEEFPTGLHRRFQLVKGASSKSAPRVQISYPDSERKDRHAGARGEIPVLMLNGNMLKDQLNNIMDRKPGDPGASITFADWFEDWFWQEMVAETKTEKGWENLRKARNEAWDLCMYALALALYRPISLELMDWSLPPSWAREWDENDMVFNPETEKSIITSARKRKSLDELAAELG